LEHSVITEHKISHQHDFDWGNVKILDEEKVLNKKPDFGSDPYKATEFDLQNDTYSLDPLYMNLFTEL